MVMWSVQICIARMGVDGGGVRVKACPDFCGTFCTHPDGQFLVLGAPFKLFQIGAVNGGKHIKEDIYNQNLGPLWSGCW